MYNLKKIYYVLLKVFKIFKLHDRNWLIFPLFLFSSDKVRQSLSLSYFATDGELLDLLSVMSKHVKLEALSRFSSFQVQLFTNFFQIQKQVI